MWQCLHLQRPCSLPGLYFIAVLGMFLGIDLCAGLYKNTATNCQIVSMWGQIVHMGLPEAHNPLSQGILNVAFTNSNRQILLVMLLSLFLKVSLKCSVKYLRFSPYLGLILKGTFSRQYLFYPLYTPILCSLPLLLIQAFATWEDHGIVSVKHLYIDGSFASFDQLSSVVNLPRTHFFRYLQIRDFIHNHFPGFPAVPPSAWVDTIFNINHYLKGTKAIQHSPYVPTLEVWL